MKKKIRNLERLVGSFLVIAGDQIVTIQRADREKQKRQMRNKH